MIKNLPANAGDVGLITGLRTSPGEGNGKSLQYFCWKILPQAEWPGGLCTWSYKRVRHKLMTKQQPIKIMFNNTHS